MTLIWIKHLFKLLVLPPAGPLLLAFIGFLVARARPQFGRALILIGVTSLALLSVPTIGGLLVRCLDRSPPLDIEQSKNAGAIVILGGGTRAYAAEYGGPTVSTITLERLRYGAQVARLTGLPVLVSGGPVQRAPAESVLMREVMVSEFGVPVRWIEARSHNTHENAVRSAAILKHSGVHQVILVGHAFDFPRSRAEFHAAGIDAIAAPIDIPSLRPETISDILPSIAGLRLSYFALYEIAANVTFYVSH